MKIAVVGTGYVGLVTAACLADMGNQVTGIDVSREKIAGLQQARIPIHEPGLKGVVEGNLQSGRLCFTTEHGEALADCDIIFIAVGTPSRDDGSADLDNVLAVARSIGQHLRRYCVVVDKSTVPVGTADRVQETIAQALAARGANVPFDVVSNPEFLKEGAAVADFQRPDRIIIGSDSARAIELMRQLYAPFSRTQEKLIVMDRRSAELSKYAANAMLATRISFMNEIAALADALGADIEQVRRGIGSDPRIGPYFLYPGAGFGGSCFPKDLRALGTMAREQGVAGDLLDAVQRVNARQKDWLFRSIGGFFGGGLAGRTVAIWGLAFKPQTDDVREAPSLTLATALLRAGVKVQAYDPEAGANAVAALREAAGEELMQRFSLVASAQAATAGADVLALVTEWKEFRSPDFAALAASLAAKAVFDGRNQYEPAVLGRYGLAYFSIGRGQAAGAGLKATAT